MPLLQFATMNEHTAFTKCAHRDKSQGLTKSDQAHRPGRLEQNLRSLFLVTEKREHGALRVLAVDDPAPSGYLHWAVNDLPAAGLNTFDGCLD